MDMRALALVLLALACALAGPASIAKTKRSRGVANAFKRAQPCPATGKSKGPCPGYVIDHVIPLACGGEDAVSNLQWQTVTAGRQKDRWERIGCDCDEPAALAFRALAPYLEHRPDCLNRTGVCTCGLAEWIQRLYAILRDIETEER